MGWRAHAGLKPASRRCEREIFLRSLALALNFLVRRARIACHRQPWSYPRRGTAGAPQRMSSRHTHFRNSLTKWPSCQIWQYSGRWERGGVDFRFRRRAETPLPDCGLLRRMRGPPSPIAMCAEGRISFSRPPTVQNDAGITPGAAWWEWHAAGKCSVPSRHHLQPNQVLPDDRIGLYSSVSAPLHSTLSLTYLGS